MPNSSNKSNPLLLSNKKIIRKTKEQPHVRTQQSRKAKTKTEEKKQKEAKKRKASALTQSLSGYNASDKRMKENDPTIRFTCTRPTTQDAKQLKAFSALTQECKQSPLFRTPSQIEQLPNGLIRTPSNLCYEASFLVSSLPIISGGSLDQVTFFQLQPATSPLQSRKTSAFITAPASPMLTSPKTPEKITLPGHRYAMPTPPKYGVRVMQVELTVKTSTTPRVLFKKNNHSMTHGYSAQEVGNYFKKLRKKTELNKENLNGSKPLSSPTVSPEKNQEILHSLARVFHRLFEIETISCPHRLKEQMSGIDFISQISGESVDFFEKHLETDTLQRLKHIADYSQWVNEDYDGINPNVPGDANFGSQIENTANLLPEEFIVYLGTQQSTERCDPIQVTRLFFYQKHPLRKNQYCPQLAESVYLIKFRGQTFKYVYNACDDKPLKIARTFQKAIQRTLFASPSNEASSKLLPPQDPEQKSNNQSSVEEISTENTEISIS